MPFSWNIVGSTGYDIEEIEQPRTIEMACPSCDHLVTFVEKELMKNLRVFGVPLVGVERGKRVFECPRCQVCIEPPDEERAKPKDDDATRTALQERLRSVEDEVWLWKGRAELAEQHGDQALAADSLQFKQRSEKEASRLRALLAQGTPSKRDEAIAKPTAPTIVAHAGGAVVDRGHEHEFAALKRKLASKQTSEESSAVPLSEPSAPHASESEPTANANVSESAVTSAPEVHSVENDFAALTARLAKQRANVEASSSAPNSDDYESLKREMAERVADDDKAVARGDVPPEAPPTEPVTGAPSDEDPMADLKRKLRKPKP